MKSLIFTIFILLFLTTITSAQTNTNPVVSITAPTQYVVVYSNQSYTISANASDADGIAKVEFYAGTKLIGTDSVAPYTSVLNTTICPLPTWSWSDWNITVKAYDKKGGMTSVSTASNVWVSLRPVYDAGIHSASVGGTEGRVLNTWFTLGKNGTTNITSATIGYQLDNATEQFLQWTGNITDGSVSPTITLPAISNSNGAHTLKLRIVSRNGQTSDEIVANDTYNYNFVSNIINKLPTVSLVAPVANPYLSTTIFSNQSYMFKATSKDPDGVVKKVDFYLNNELIGSDDTEPYELTKSAIAAGTYTVVAKTTDDSDAVVASSAAKLIVKPSLDIALSDIKQPLASATTTAVTPIAALKNTGFETITSATVTYNVDGGETKTFDWTGSLAAGLSVNVTLPIFRNENGSHTFVATVSNPNGGVDGDLTNNTMTRTFTSAVVNGLPNVRMLTPASTSTAFSGTEFTFSASATDKDQNGWITKVEFYLGSILLGTDTEAPYELKRSDIAVGIYAITAKAYDERGGVSTSTATTLKVIPALNIALTTIAQPTLAPTTTAVAPVVSIKNLGNIVITSATIVYTLDGGAPKSFDWTGSLAANAAVNVTLPTFRNENGSHTFVATVSNPNGGVDGDESNNSLTRAFTSAVVNGLPNVRMLTPASTSTIYSGTEFIFSASATDRDLNGWITKVEFYLGSTLLGTDTEAPYELKRSDIAVGTYAITAKAYDEREGVSTSTATTLKVIPALNIALTAIAQPTLAPTTTAVAPVVSIKNLGNIVVTTATIVYTLDGGAPKSFDWTGSLAANAAVNVTLPTFRNENGSHTFVATVSNPNGGVDGDESNNSMTRAFISAVVNGLPNVRMLTPASTSTAFSGTEFTFSASATDKDQNGWITKVEFYLGSTLLGTDTEAPYELKRSDIAVGTYAITAKAYDEREGVSTSATTTLKVIPALNIALTSIVQPTIAPTTTTVAPIVSIKNMGNITLTTATITYILDGSEAKTFNWMGSLAAGLSANVTLPIFRNENGNHTIVTTVSNPNGGVDGDDSNNTLTRAFTSVIFNVFPTVSMTAPVYRSTIKASDTYTMAANAADRDGTVTKVEFYLGSTLLGTDSVAPFALTFNKWQAGTFAVTAKAYDDRNGLTISAATTLIVTPVIVASVVQNNSTISQQNDVLVANQNTVQNAVDSYIQSKKVVNSLNQLSIVPNPASDYTNLTIDLPKDGVFNLHLANMSGETVQAKTVQLYKGNNSIEIDVDALPAGLYIISFYNNATKIMKKLVVSK